MMQCVFHDTDLHLELAPLTLTRPVSELRMGLFTNTKRWLKMLGNNHNHIPHAYATEKYLHSKYNSFEEETEALHINGAIIPDESLVQEVLNLKMDEELRSSDSWIARKGVFRHGMEVRMAINQPIAEIKHSWDLFRYNAEVIETDFNFITQSRKSQSISSSNTIIGDASRIFLEPGAKVEASILNATNGSIYIGKDAEIMEGSMVRGGLALMENATLKMGTKLYGATTIGPYCKVGGEVSNSVFQAYSNKGHDGFLGNSIIGEWCNLGADTNSSNLKNNYSPVKVHSYKKENLVQTDLQFLGLIMGDHSKSGINTMFNTATVVGVSANVFGEGFPPKYIPSFTWGAVHSQEFLFEKACEVANNMMQRRGLELSSSEKSILKYLADKEKA